MQGTQRSRAARGRGERLTSAGASAGTCYRLALTAPFPLVGIGPAPGAASGARIRLERSRRADIERGWPGGETVSSLRGAGGTVAAEIAVHPEAGHLMRARSYGVFHLSADRSLLRCAPERFDRPLWQRYLLAQALPYAAGLHGIELLHAAGLGLDGGAIAIAGPSGAGKSTLAAWLLGEGATLLADDVLALAQDDGSIKAHVGPGVLHLTADASGLLGPARRRRVGSIVGRDLGRPRVAAQRAKGPLPLRALYLLEQDERAETIAPLEPVHPQRLLATAYDLVHRSPERLVRHLDLCARIAATVPCFRVSVSRSRPLAATATALAEHAREMTA